MENIKDFLKQYGVEIKKEPQTPSYTENDKVNKFITYWIKKGFKYNSDVEDGGLFEGYVYCNFNKDAKLVIDYCYDEAGGDNDYNFKITIEDSIYDYFSNESVRKKIYTYYLQGKNAFEKEMYILEKAIEMFFELEKIKKQEGRKKIMICYRDKTFCPFWKNCKLGEKCKRKLTKQIEKEAKDFGLPIMVYIDKPECFIESEKNLRKINK